MSVPLISKFPTAPSRNDAPEVFTERANAFLGHLATNFEPQANTQAAFTDARATAAATSATSAASSANAAETSRVAAVGAANYKGEYVASTTYTVGQSVSFNGVVYVAKMQNQGVTPVSGTRWLVVDQVPNFTYDNRGALRTLIATEAIVRELGVFEYFPGAADVDDDETAFSTGAGFWLLVSPSYEAAQAYDAFEDEAQDDRLDGHDARLDVLEGLATTVTFAAATIGSISQVTMTASIAGVTTSDHVIATPRNALGTAASDQARLHLVAYVSSANTVTVSIRNASAASAAIGQTVVNVKVIKGA